jgi:hypothetical protein
MVSMLPGAAASALSVVGITGSSGLAIALAAVAQPLFIASAILVLISALACSRLVTALSAAGVTLLYLSMFQLATSTATSVRTAALAAWRRHTHRCRPLLRVPQLRTARN